MAFFDLLKIPELKNVAAGDACALTLMHEKILARKTFLRRLYSDFYNQMKAAIPEPDEKVIVELGSGGGFIREVIKNALTSDVLNLPNVDRVFSAMDMPFNDSTVDAFCMFDVLHHIPQPRRFFAEAGRCLRPGGRIVMIEPANTPWARFVYKNLHHEPFDPAGQWRLDEGSPMFQANGAMPWIIFVRDREIFQREFPRLRIVSLRNHTPLRYLFSGGFTLRQLMPGFLYPLARGIEYLLSPADNWLGMFMTVIIEKTKA